MAPITDIVQVTITVATATVTRRGFGIPLILAYFDTFPERARRYGNLGELLDDGFTQASRVYKMANVILSQNPRPEAVIVGRRATAPSRTVKLTPRSPPLAGTVYDITINDEVMAYTSDATPTVAEIANGITLSVNGGTQNVLATDNTTDLDIESADAPGGTPAADVPFQLDYDKSLWEFADSTADAGLAADLAAVQTANNDWYAICCDALGPAEITALATAVEPLKKVYLADTQDTDTLGSGSTDIASVLKAAALGRSAVQFHPSSDPSYAAGWMGLVLPYDPGSVNWMFNTITGLSPYSLTSSERANLTNKYGNRYEEVGGQNITAEGRVADGSYIDIVRAVDWTQARMEERIFRALVINKKIPQTNLGIQTIVNEVDGVLRDGVSRGVFSDDPAPTSSAPLASEISAADKEARTLPDIRFRAQYANPINKVIVEGRIVL